MTSLPNTPTNSATDAHAVGGHLRLVRDDARAAALAAWPYLGGGEPDTLDLARLLGILGYKAGEFVSICHKIGDGSFNSSVVALADAATDVGGLSVHADIWFGTNPTKGPAREGRKGKADQVTRLAALTADLDVKDDGCPDFATCWAIINDLSNMLGTPPTVVVESGHGLQPYWVLSDGDRDSATGNGISITVLLRRWGRLVAAALSV